ncbi:hypothetical protein BDK51DRAFT_27988, partial [Blyttiomyces helicus]
MGSNNSHEIPPPQSATPASTSGLQGWLAGHLRGRDSTTAEADTVAEAAAPTPTPAVGGSDISDIAIIPSGSSVMLAGGDTNVPGHVSRGLTSSVRASSDVYMKVIAVGTQQQRRQEA